jgi:hypothetical protein
MQLSWGEISQCSARILVQVIKKTKLQQEACSLCAGKISEFSHDISTIRLRTECQRKGTHWTRFTLRRGLLLITCVPILNLKVSKFVKNALIL